MCIVLCCSSKLSISSAETIALTHCKIPLSSIGINGLFVQGGIVCGNTAPDTQIHLNGQRVRISSNGSFIFGFGRDFPSTATITVTRNKVPNDYTIYIAPRQYKEQHIHGVPQRTVSPKPEDFKRIRQESQSIVTARQVDSTRTDFVTGFHWPVRGRISGVYGSQRTYNGVPRRPHYGVDIAVSLGTPVRAPTGGVVTLVHPDMFFSGGTLIIDHGHGISSAFLHLETINVAVGDTVQQGEEIATVGSSGRATGPHLDWRINWFTQRLDPQLLVLDE